KPRKNTNGMIGQIMTMDVIYNDVPRSVFPQTREKCNQFCLSEVVKEQGAYHNIVIFGIEFTGEDIEWKQSYRWKVAQILCRVRNNVGVCVDSCQVYSNAFPVSPCRNDAQHVAASTTEIRNAEGSIPPVKF